MRTVGQILYEARIDHGFTLEQVEKATKIRNKFLLSIEKDDYQKLPGAPYIQGFIKNYGDFLGLNSATLLALFRRQFVQKEKQKKAVLEEPLTLSSWQMTPNKAIVVLVSILIIVFFSYFFMQYSALRKPPPLILENPKNEEVITKEEIIAVYGQTDSDATVIVNQEPVLVKEDGKFFKEVTLTIGGNTLVIEASSRAGKKTTVMRKVTRLPLNE